MPLPLPSPVAAAPIAAASVATPPVTATVTPLPPPLPQQQLPPVATAGGDSGGTVMAAGVRAQQGVGPVPQQSGGKSSGS